MSTQTQTIDSNGALDLRNVSVSLGNRELVSINHTIKPGEVLTVRGPSGSGKSTLLAFISGFLDPAFSVSGSVFLDGRELNQIAPERRSVGILFQDALLFPHMSVGENLVFAVPADIKGKEARKKTAGQALTSADLVDFFDRDPATLSGGQRARVALMRVLLARPKALLLDEPFSKLDTEMRGTIRDFIFNEARERGLPVLLVTHDESDAIAAGGAVYEMAQNTIMPSKTNRLKSGL